MAYCRFIEDTSSDWERERTNLLGAYHARLTSGDPAMQNAAASAFVGYELSISKTFVDPASIEEALATPSALIPFALFEVVLGLYLIVTSQIAVQLNLFILFCQLYMYSVAVFLK